MRELTLNETEEVSGGGKYPFKGPFEGLSPGEIDELLNPHHNQVPPGYLPPGYLPPGY